MAEGEASGGELAEVQELREAIRRFARAELAPHAAELDRTATFPHRHIPKLAEMGLMGMNLPPAHGGPGVSAHGLGAAVEEVAAACGGTASMMTAHFLATDAILLGGDEALKARYLPAAARGETLGAFGLTEPAAGSNPADMRTSAVREGSGYRIRGTKHFISNGGVADFIVVFAITDPATGARGISAFVVDRATPGVTPGKPEPTMGVRAGQVFEIGFDCLVPEANRIGAEGSGFRTAMAVLDRGRIEVASMAIGIAQAALDEAVGWAKQRVISGQPLAANQGIQWMLADMATELDAARLLTHRAAGLRESGKRFSREASMAKLFASEMAARVTDQALQIHGGYGYTAAMNLERYVRDVRIFRIYEGSSEIQRTIIARHVLAQHSPS